MPTRSRFATFLAVMLSVCINVFGQASPASLPGSKAAVAGNYGKLPLSFEANRGQTDPQVRFLSRGNGYSLFLTDSAAVLALTKNEAPAAGVPTKNGCPIHAGGCVAGVSGTATRPDAKKTKTDVVRMELAGASHGIRVTGTDQLPETANYFIGKDPAKWHSAVPTYAKVKYSGVYPGIDLVYYGNQRQLEYDFIVAANADAKPIRLRFGGAKKLKLDADGGLRVIAEDGEIAFHKPVVYQEIEGQRKAVAGAFSLLDKNAVAFTVGQYDHGRPLVIDPVLVYSTYLGGTNGGDYGGDFAEAIAVDKDGNTYVAGQDDSTNFPTTQGAYLITNTSGGTDAFITKFDPTGTTALYSTLIGPTNSGNGFGIAVDASGNAYLTGQTNNSEEFPVVPMPGAFQTTNAGYQDAFVTKLNSTGTALEYSTYLGGSYTDGGAAIAVDSAGDAYVTGYTDSQDFPVTKNAYQLIPNPKSTGNHANVFVTELNPQGTEEIYSTYLGGSSSGGDYGTAIALDSSDHVYVTGYTYSTDFPISEGAFQFVNVPGESGGHTSFVTSLVTDGKTAGSGLIYSTFLGGSSSDAGAGIAVDSTGDAYVTGTTGSTDFPVTSGAFQTANPGSFVAFVAKLNPTGTKPLMYATYLAGSSYLDSSAPGNAIAVDGLGEAYVTGYTSSSKFPVTPGALRPLLSGRKDAFVVKLNPTGTAPLLYSTYLGGSYDDLGNAIALDAAGNAYVAGQTFSGDFPVLNAYQPVNNGVTNNDSNGFISKLAIGGETTSTLTSSANPQLQGYPITFSAAVVADYSESVPTGNMVFSVDGAADTSVALDDTGHASYTTSSLTAGPAPSHTIQVSYSGDANFLTSTASVKQTVLGAIASNTAVSGSGQTTVYGSSYSKPLVVIVKDMYGNPFPKLEVTFSGAGLNFSSSKVTTGSNGEASTTVTAAATGNLTATATVTGGSGPLTATFTLTATKAVLTVTATSITVPYNEPIPTLTWVPSGFVLKDNPSVLSGAPVETTNAMQGSPEGTYLISISQGTLSAANYTFIFVNGTLTIVPQTPVIRPGTGVFGSAQTVTISDAEAGAAVYYTTNGSNPTQSSQTYQGPFNLAATAIVKAISLVGQNVSEIAQAAIVIGPDAPVYSDGIVTTIGGIRGQPGFAGDGGPFAMAQVDGAVTIATDSQNNLYICELGNNDVREVDAATGVITTVAGDHAKGAGYSGDNGPATAAQLNVPQGIAVDSAGNLFIADTDNNIIRKVTKSTGIITTVAGTGQAGDGGDGGLATAATLASPVGVAVDSGGNLYISNTAYSVVRKVSATTGVITTIAGASTGAGYAGDGGPATMAVLSYPSALALDSANNLYITDNGNNVIRRIAARTGIITTYAGNCIMTGGVCGHGYSGDGGAATAALLDNPNQIAFDPAGNLYIADTFNNVVRQVNAKAGTITTAAGNGMGADATAYGTGGFSGDNGPGILAEFDDPQGVAFDSSGNLYISDYWNSIIRKVAPAGPIVSGPPALQFIPVTPCRVVDTRNATGPFGGPSLTAGATRGFDIPQSGCAIPSTAVAYSLNTTVVPAGELDYLTLWPAGQSQPNASTLNSLDGRIKANAAITPAGTNGGVDVYVSDATNVIIDIDGYFVPAGTTGAATPLAFYPLTPCRIADTRNASGPLGGPFLGAATSRSFPVQSSACNIPATAQAYSLNVTALPHTTLTYLTTWPTGESQPNVSTLNALTGAITANAAIVPAGNSASTGAVSIYVSDDADVILDVNGYFAPPATGGLSLYSTTPCRALDTRSSSGAFNGTLGVAIGPGACPPPATAQAFVLNATVVPSAALNYLTLWPDGETQPTVSTLNALDGAITSNMAIVPATNGSIDAFSSNPTQLILDISSYFAP